MMKMRYPLAFVIAFTVCGSVTAAAQTRTPNLDFEDGLQQWTPVGTAFSAPPVLGSSVLTDTAVRIPIGGSYWRGLPFPIGQHGDRFLQSSDAGEGTLTSMPLTLRSTDRYFSVLVGGPIDPAHERVELQVRPRSAGEGSDLRRDG